MGHSRATIDAIDPDLLLEQSGWVRNLARGLVRDPVGADDVAQETMLAALSSPPRDAGDAQRLRAWLGRVAFNLAHLRTRRNARRRAREERVARSETQCSTADSVVQSSVTSLVADAVMELPEPYRGTVVMRYFEGLSTAEIARRTGASDTAVRKRLWRARARLRDELDSRHNGDRLAWFRALAPVAGFPATEAAIPGGATTGAGATGTPVFAGSAVGAGTGAPVLAGTAAAAALLLGLAALLHGGSEARAAAGAAVGNTGERIALGLAPSLRLPVLEGGAASSHDDRARDAGRAPASPSVVRTDREAVEPRRDPEDVPVLPAAPRISGQVIDLWGHPLGDVGVADASRPARTLATTSADGRFSFVAPRLPLTLTVSATGYAPVRQAVCRPGEAGWSQWLVAAPSVDVAGLVVDGEGRALAHAEVAVVFDDAAFVQLPVLADVRTLESPHRTTDEEGRFHLPGIPTGPGIGLSVTHEGFARSVRPVPAFDSLDLWLALDALPVDEHRLAGVVEDEDGYPLAGVLVASGTARDVTDAAGEFLLITTAGEGAGPVVASKSGYMATHAPPPAFADDGSHGPPTARMRMVMDRPREISGRLVDQDGEPVEGWIVQATIPEDEGSRSGAPADPSEADPGPEAGGASFARTDQDGAFVVGGLRGRTYELVAYQPDLLAMTSTEARPGDEDVELCVALCRNGGPGRASGHLTDELGRPLDGAKLTVVLDLVTPSGLRRARSQPVVTDSRGSFSMDSFPGGTALLEIAHPSLGVTIVRPDAALRGAPNRAQWGASLDMAVQLEARFRVRGFEGTSIRVLDAGGRPLTLRGPLREAPSAPLLRGRSTVLGVEGEGAWLVWSEEDRELGRRPLDLSRGEVVEIHR